MVTWSWVKIARFEKSTSICCFKTRTFCYFKISIFQLGGAKRLDISRLNENRAFALQYRGAKQTLSLGFFNWSLRIGCWNYRRRKRLYIGRGSLTPDFWRLILGLKAVETIDDTKIYSLGFLFLLLFFSRWYCAALCLARQGWMPLDYPVTSSGGWGQLPVGFTT